MDTRKKEESGIILVIVVFALALGVFGYVAINNFSKSREAERQKQASQPLDTAQDAKVNVNEIIN
jgi:flagellar basal body-associated protein FliL